MSSIPQSGLQAERTALSWDRTVLGILVNGTLVLLHQTGALHPGRIVAALCAVLVAVLCVWARRRRARALRPLACGAPPPRPAGGQVLALGVAVAVLCLVVAAVSVLEAFVPAV